jgi:hypothetical protein
VAVIETRQALNQVHGQAADIAEQLNSLIGLLAGTILNLEDPMPPRLLSTRRTRRQVSP